METKGVKFIPKNSQRELGESDFLGQVSHEWLVINLFWNLIWIKIQMNQKQHVWLHPRSLTARPWKMMVGRLLSFWDGIFSKAMLNFEGVACLLLWSIKQKDVFPGVFPSKSMEKARRLPIFCARMQVYIRYCTIAVTKMTSPFWPCVCVCVS